MPPIGGVTAGLGEGSRRLSGRIADLEARALVSDESALLAETLQELRASLEEMRVLEEELQAQGDELRSARGLLESEHERYKSLFELAPDAYLVTDATGQILEANRAAVVLFGVEHRSLVGNAIASLVPPEERKSFRRQFRKFVEAAGVSEAEGRFRGRTRVFDANISIAPVRRGQALEGLRWIVRDVTARKQAERELRTLTLELERRVSDRMRELEGERARLQTIVEHLPAGLLIIDTSGEPTFMNGAAKELLADIRATDEPRYAEHWPAFRRDGDPYPESERPATRALRFGETTRSEQLYFERRDGTRVPFGVSAAPIVDPAGKIVAAVVTLQDLSDRERLERSEREFVANAAHELRSPIAAVVSAVEVLQAGAKESPEERDVFLGHIEREANRLRRLAHALLVLARAQAGVDAIEPQIVDVRQLLEAVAETLEPNGEVNVAVDCASDLWIWSDADLLDQAVASLAHNAVAHTSAGQVTLGASRSDSTIAIEVRDTGPGIAPADQARIFERFFRGNGAGGREGFGLGLAIVREAAAALAAEVEVESEVGTGTTIRLRLPGKLEA
jgi:two-component system phosphate regulon sensor histidine kinase PhoR